MAPPSGGTRATATNASTGSGSSGAPIAQGRYRYTSSVINGPHEWVYDEMGYPTRLDIFPQEIEGFGITNTPALATLAMFAADEDTMDKHTIEIALGKLGLSPAAVATLSALPLEQIQQRLTAATFAGPQGVGDQIRDPGAVGSLAFAARCVPGVIGAHAVPTGGAA